MVNRILAGAGMELDVTYKETRFLKPPKSTYAVYSDNKTVRGPDNINAIVEHNVTIDLFEYVPDPEIEKAIEDQLDAAGQPYVKQARYWLFDEQLFQVIYSFTYIEKGVF